MQKEKIEYINMYLKVLSLLIAIVFAGLGFMLESHIDDKNTALQKKEFWKELAVDLELKTRQKYPEIEKNLEGFYRDIYRIRMQYNSLSAEGIQHEDIFNDAMISQNRKNLYKFVNNIMMQVYNIVNEYKLAVLEYDDIAKQLNIQGWNDFVLVQDDLDLWGDNIISPMKKIVVVLNEAEKNVMKIDSFRELVLEPIEYVESFFFENPPPHLLSLKNMKQKNIDNIKSTYEAS